MSKLYPPAQQPADYPENPFVGTPTAADAYPNPAPIYPAPTAQPASKHSGMVKNLINLLIMGIPIVGLALAIIWGLDRDDANKRDLARAMIIVSAIWHVIFIVGFILFISMMRQVAEIVDLDIIIFGIKIV